MRKHTNFTPRKWRLFFFEDIQASYRLRERERDSLELQNKSVFITQKQRKDFESAQRQALQACLLRSDSRILTDDQQGSSRTAISMQNSKLLEVFQEC